MHSIPVCFLLQDIVRSPTGDDVSNAGTRIVYVVVAVVIVIVIDCR